MDDQMVSERGLVVCLRTIVQCDALPHDIFGKPHTCMQQGISRSGMYAIVDSRSIFLPISTYLERYIDM